MKWKKYSFSLLISVVISLFALSACTFNQSPSVKSVSQILTDNGYKILDTVEASDYDMGLQIKLLGIKVRLTAYCFLEVVVIEWYYRSTDAQDAYNSALRKYHNNSNYVLLKDRMLASGSERAIALLQ